MSDISEISIPTSVAHFIRPEATVELRLQGAAGGGELPPDEQLLLLFYLSKDQDPFVTALALATLAELSKERITSALSVAAPHPAILHLLAQVRGVEPWLNGLLFARADLLPETKQLLEADQISFAPSGSIKAAVEQQAGQGMEGVDGAQDESQDNGAVYQSKYQQAQEMGVADKIKMALTGDKEWRQILVKDSNKLVSAGVLKNPRMTEPEVLTLLKSGVQNDEVMRLICANKEWVKNYAIRKALIENPKTPLATALRFLGSVTEKDLASFAKSRNISSVIVTQARRMMMNKKK